MRLNTHGHRTDMAWQYQVCAHTHTHTDMPDPVEDGQQFERPVDVGHLSS